MPLLYILAELIYRVVVVGHEMTLDIKSHVGLDGKVSEPWHIMADASSLSRMV